MKNRIRGAFMDGDNGENLFKKAPPGGCQCGAENNTQAGLATPPTDEQQTTTDEADQDGGWLGDRGEHNIVNAGKFA